MTLPPCHTLQNVIQTQKCVPCRGYAPPKQMCFQVFSKESKQEEEDLKSAGRTFQLLGPATAKYLNPQSVRWLGTTMSQWAADLKADRPGTNEVLTQQSARYAGAKPCRHLNIIIHSLFVMYWGYGSQCKSTRAWVMWSNRFKPKIKRAAEFNTDWSCCMRDQGKHARTLLQKSNRLWTNACTNRSLDSTDKAFPKRRTQQTKLSPNDESDEVGNNSSDRHAKHVETLSYYCQVLPRLRTVWTGVIWLPKSTMSSLTS